MAKNDVILLDGIIDQRLAENLPSAERDEVFEFLCLEQLLKDFDLSRDELESGWIDGRDDGGFDGAYALVNGHLVEDVEDFLWPKTNGQIDVWLISCKHHPTFVQATLDAMLATIQELFDLSRGNDELKGSYSADLLEFRGLLATVLKKLSIGRPSLKFHLAYASRGDTHEIGASVAARSRQIETEFAKLFSSCSVTFAFVGATELLESYRKQSGEFVFMDCASESPAGRRIGCYVRQKLNVVNQTRSNLFGWRDQFTPEFNPIGFAKE
jgi:hypothetical protein